MLAYKTAHQLIELLEAKSVSSSEILDAYLERLATLNPALNAVCWLDEESARKQASAVTAPPDEAAPLRGLPMTVKEAYDLVGAPTTWGMPAYRDNIATRDAVVVARLKQAGAIIYGKTNVSTGLDDIQSHNEVYGTTNNPWNTARTSGGSSGGSAAALASGLTSLEAGSDIGGSIRTPANFCGVFGHKPTWALIPARGHALPGSLAEPDISVVGPMARSARDLKLLLGVLAAPDDLDRGLKYELPALGSKTLKDLRVAVWANDEIAPVSPEVEARVHAIAQTCRDAGCVVNTQARPSFSSQRSHDVYMGLLAAFGGTQLSTEHYAETLEAANELSPDMAFMIDGDPRRQVISHHAWHALHEKRQALRWHWHEFFKDFDVVFAPQTATSAFAHDHRPMNERTLEVGGFTQPYWQQIFWAGLVGISQLPSTVVPTGPDGDGLPIGVQIIGPAYGDRVTIEVAELLEREGYEFQVPPGYRES